MPNRNKPLKPESRSGGQTIERAALLMRLIGRNSASGLRLSELQLASGLTHGTVHRILKALGRAGWVKQQPSDRRYRLGQFNWELGIATEFSWEFRDAIRPRMARLSEISGETIHLVMRTGAEYVCLDFVRGANRLRNKMADVGDRRPLCFGSVGWALMSLLPDGEIDEIIEANHRDLAGHRRITEKVVRREISRSRASGYAIAHDSTIVGLSALGIALRSSPSRPPLAISVGMASERFTKSRVAELLDFVRGTFDGELFFKSR